MKTGPKTAPTALKIIRGNPGHRPLNRDEPRPAEGIPDMPADVAANPKAKAYWKDTADRLIAMRVLTVADKLALRGLCMAAAEESDAEEVIARDGMQIRTKRTGMIHLNPALAIRDRAAQRVYRYLREFGLTPSARSSIKTAPIPEPDADQWQKF